MALGKLCTVFAGAKFCSFDPQNRNDLRLRVRRKVEGRTQRCYGVWGLQTTREGYALQRRKERALIMADREVEINLHPYRPLCLL